MLHLYRTKPFAALKALLFPFGRAFLVCLYSSCVCIRVHCCKEVCTVCYQHKLTKHALIRLFEFTVCAFWRFLLVCYLLHAASADWLAAVGSWSSLWIALTSVMTSSRTSSLPLCFSPISVRVFAGKEKERGIVLSSWERFNRGGHRAGGSLIKPRVQPGWTMHNPYDLWPGTCAPFLQQ